MMIASLGRHGTEPVGGNVMRGIASLLLVVAAAG
jgi:hypothetical protein